VEIEELIDIQEVQTAKTKHKECSPINFWLSMASSYTTLASHAVPQLLAFPSTWKSEQGFTVMMNIILKKRNRLVRPDMTFDTLLTNLRLNLVVVVYCYFNAYYSSE